MLKFTLPYPPSVINKIQKTDTCWIWTGSKITSGYGNLGVSWRANRFSYFIYVDQDYYICHSCDNPQHLFKGSQKDNVQDMLSKGRNNSQIILKLR